MQRQKATEIALETINNDTAILPGITLELSSRDTEANQEAGASGMFELASTVGVPIAVGAASSSVSMAASLVGRIFGVPLVSYSSTNADLSNKVVYPLFARTCPVDSLQAEALVALCQQFGWKRASLIGADTSYASGLLNDFESNAEKAGISISKRVTHPALATSASTAVYETELVARMETLSTSTARIVIMANLDADAISVVKIAREKGMIGAGSGWTWLGVDGWLQSSLFDTNAICDADCAALNAEAVKGIIGTAPRVAAAALSDWQTNMWNPRVGSAQLTQAQKTGSNLTSWAGSNLNSFAPFAYDAGLAVSHALHQLCFNPTASGLAAVGTAAECKTRLSGGSAIGASLYKELVSVKVSGATGVVQFSSDGDRSLDFQILNINNNGAIQEVGYWVAAENIINSTTPCAGAFETCANIHWPGGGGVPSDGFLVVCAVGEERAFSVSGDSFCVTCTAGTFNLDPDSTCKPCPRGAVCSGGSSLAAEPGYWQLQVNLPQVADVTQVDYDTVVMDPEFFACRSAPFSCCPAGGCTANTTSMASMTSLCATNRQGVLCSWCTEGFTLWAGECLPCEGVNGLLLTLVVFAVMIVIVVLVIRPPSKSGAGLIVIDYYQLTTIISVPKTESGSSIFSYMTLVFNLSPNDVGSACPAELTPLQGASLGYFIPALMLGSLVFMYSIVWAYGKLRIRNRLQKQHTLNPVAQGAGASSSKESQPKRRPTGRPNRFKQFQLPEEKWMAKMNSRFLVGFWRVIFFIYAGASVTSLTMLNCRSVGEYLVLESHPNVFCWDADHTALAVLSFPVFACLTLGVPAYIAVTFRIHRARLRRNFRKLILQRRRQMQAEAAARGDAVEATEQVHENKVVKAGTQFVKRILPNRGHTKDANMYRAGIRQWFPSVFFLRRAVLIVVAVYLAEDTVWRQIALFIGCLILLGLQLLFRPFGDRIDDSVATVSMIALLLVAGVQLYVASVAVSADLRSQHISSGRAEFQTVMDFVLLATPAMWLVYVNAGKIYRSIEKRREAGFLCFKPKVSRGMMAEMARQEAAAANGSIELKATRRTNGSPKKASNPVAFTDLTPSQV